MIFNEDDVSAVWEHNIVYPFATGVIVPNCCDVGIWTKKKIGYEGYHELAYLDSKYFTPDYEVVRKFFPDGGRYFLLRLANRQPKPMIGTSHQTKGAKPGWIVEWERRVLLAS